MTASTKKHSLWYKDAVIYELHVKAFFDGNGDGIGDFAGLMARLDYLEYLGVNAVWLLPFYPSPFRDDGYDISDYRGIHPAYGTLKDFRAFVREAHRRGIRVITELVLNHTSDQHPWFQAARRAKPGSAKRNFYVWSDTDTAYSGTRIIFTDTETSNWAWDPVAGAYYWHRFFSHQPDLNYSNPRVLKEMIRILRFWLDMGVDGLRLDAVPYLCEREGTNNENLPETHFVIKKIRRELDSHYSERMLLAEANQWPEDVVSYFGDGDECHMAFHFPIMPRLYMAIRREDRRPITEIIERTPPIPDTCQWTIFLRNHDELTLEMVTDEERDYMYKEYAKDPRMRVNVGIRRRLAPLVDNSLRRIELLNSLLFSLPGTPVIYYGDEIGMGDNIYLGDRDGVRTPMQWSSDRNAGFSTADTARLYLPVIMDPVYGYGAVNVEAQKRTPSSLLQFMRRMIALRKQHRAFGRGSIEFLKPTNRKVLAFLRRYKREAILVAANLSRFVQPVELDLSEFQGWTPVEMIGRTEFPTIGELPYFLTLGPHAFYWFTLEPQAEPLRIGEAAPGEPPVFPNIYLPEGLDSLFSPEHRITFEKDVLPAFLQRQRWFRGKARELISVHLNDWAKLGAGFFMTFVEVSYADGLRETYCLPMKLVVGTAAERLARDVPEGVISGIRTPMGDGVVFDALMDKVSCGILFMAMANGEGFPTHASARLSAFPTKEISERFEEKVTFTSVRRMKAEQSNTSVILDDQFIMKIFRKIEEGQNPDLEIGLYLMDKTPFRNMAPVAGGICLQDPDGRTSSVAMLQAFIPNQGDGWSFIRGHMEDFLRSGIHIPHTTAGSPFELASHSIPQAVREALDPLLSSVEILGKRTGEFHLALSCERRDPAFIPIPMTSLDLLTLSNDFSKNASEALNLLQSRLHTLSGEAEKTADAVISAGPALIRRFEEISRLRTGGLKIRCHGDYHLGQVLRVDDDFILIDFEGEPLKPIAERREKGSPLKDVAGMLRSFGYAAQCVVMEIPSGDADLAPMKERALALERWISAAFLRSYLEAINGTDLLPSEDKDLASLLAAFLLNKAFYELAYEINNRPSWIHIPLDGILSLAD